MHKRDTERKHSYADAVFIHSEIYDIQGILKEGNEFKCGIEAYQVKEFSFVSFHNFNTNEELARFTICKQLMIPYYIIITSEKTAKYRIYDTKESGGKIFYNILKEYTEEDFVVWWRDRQSFTQKKAMYNAASRIKDSMIDQLLFKNSLSWGANIDGFSLNKQTNLVNAIYEKRICTYKPPYTIENYDPNRFFHGTRGRAGDFKSWNILFQLSKKLSAALILLTFDTSVEKSVGATKINNIEQQNGITYLNNKKPFQNIYNNNLEGLSKWIKQNL